MANTIKISPNQWKKWEEGIKKWLEFDPAILCKGKKVKVKDIKIYKKK